MATSKENEAITKANIQNASAQTKQLKRLAVLLAVLSQAREHLEASQEHPVLLLDINDLQQTNEQVLTELTTDATDIILSMLELLPEGVLRDDITRLLRFLKGPDGSF